MVKVLQYIKEAIWKITSSFYIFVAAAININISRLQKLVFCCAEKQWNGFWKEISRITFLDALNLDEKLVDLSFIFIGQYASSAQISCHI